MGSAGTEISKNLLYYRKQKKITQKELAEKLGVKHNTISGWEHGTNSIDVEILFQICKILDISLNEMYGVSPSTQDFTPHEKNLIEKYRALDERGKKAIDDNLAREYEFAKSN